MNKNKIQILSALYAGYQTKCKNGTYYWTDKKLMTYLFVPSLNNSDVSALIRAGMIQPENGNLQITKWGEVILRDAQRKMNETV